MAKHRKTRREKKIADNRHSIYHLEIESIQEVKKPTKITEKSTITHKVENPTSNQAVSLAYVSHDLKKTILITSAILATQIVLFIILNRV